eukprot:gnl/MRDRNA2_/MRDRNA2_36044_c0_seq1.p1 gnl/MRDRNA2_/MRDRNA2_36044_c0~~gnl/MRDRNA2_/MRDRNA2_36044_c0_seq1.p1  ORF type:complete len:232 (+),score=29.60 gnl/MRDRNA2_/MRDRNA2_36044_c0_seq1:67-762(+)
MPDPDLAFQEPLLHEVVPRRVCCGRQVLAVLFFGAGVSMLLNSLDAGSAQNLSETTLVGSHLQPVRSRQFSQQLLGTMPLLQPMRTWQSLLPKMTRTIVTPPAAKSDDDFDARLEKITQQGKGFGEPQAKTKKNVDPLQGNPIQAERKIPQNAGPANILGDYEGPYVGFLGLFGVFILAEGVFLAASGFLPEELDNFALTVVFPSFSPTVGIFLLLSTIYGVIKSQSEGQS